MWSRSSDWTQMRLENKFTKKRTPAPLTWLLSVLKRSKRKKCIISVRKLFNTLRGFMLDELLTTICINLNSKQTQQRHIPWREASVILGSEAKKKKPRIYIQRVNCFHYYWFPQLEAKYVFGNSEMAFDILVNWVSEANIIHHFIWAPGFCCCCCCCFF